MLPTVTLWFHETSFAIFGVQVLLMFIPILYSHFVAVHETFYDQHTFL